MRLLFSLCLALICTLVRSFPLGNVFYTGRNSLGYGWANITGVGYPTGNMSKTISFWIHQPPGLTIDTTRKYELLNLVPDLSSNCGELSISFSATESTLSDGTTSKSGGQLFVGEQCLASGVRTPLTVTSPLLYQTWTHVALTFSSSSQNLTAYLNGVPVGNMPTAFLPQTSSLLRLGFGTIVYLDDIRIWSRALNSSEIFTVFRSPSNPIAANLVLWFNFDSDAIFTANVVDAQQVVTLALTSNATIAPLSASNFSGYFVPAGQTSPTICNAGTYCPYALCSGPACLSTPSSASAMS
jgi:hypothetical protein